MLRRGPYLFAVALLGCGDADPEKSDEAPADRGLTDQAIPDAATMLVPDDAASCTQDSCSADAAVRMQMDEVCEVVKRDAPPRALPVDIIFVIENGFSQFADIRSIQLALSALTMDLAGSGIDYTLMIVNRPLSWSQATESFVAGAPWDPQTLGLDPARFVWLDDESVNDCYQTATGRFPWYSARLRAESAVHFVMVANWDSFVTWQSFHLQMSGLLGREFTVHAVTAPPDAPCPGGATPAPRYWQGADATGGERASICSADWSKIVTAVAGSVGASASVPCEYDIPPPPSGEQYARTKVNVEHVQGTVPTPLKRRTALADCGAEGGWFYDNAAEPKRVHLCPSSCSVVQEKGGAVRASFVCDERVLY